MFTLRHSTQKDIPVIMEVISLAQEYFRKQGIDQWQNGYPNTEVISNDVSNGSSYVLLQDEQILATAVILFDADPNYTHIDGRWITGNPYVVIHRIAVRPEYKGRNMAGWIIEKAEQMCTEKGFTSIRIDTHQENRSMQQVALKSGFLYCGIIKVADGSPRLAYEKVL